MCVTVLFLNSVIFVSAQNPIKETNVRAHMEFLASDAMQGRGSGTMFELLAGEYLASQMKQFGIEPAGDKDSEGNPTYIQTINISRNSFIETPKLSYSDVSLEHGNEMLVLRMATEKISGKLQIISPGETPQKGAVVFVQAKSDDEAKALSESFGSLAGSGAAAIIIEETSRWRSGWERTGSRPVSFTSISGGKDNPSTGIFILSKAAAAKLAESGEGTNIEISGKLDKPETRKTWNAVGMIKGTDAKLSAEVILLSAHMDHLGIRENAPGDDKLFNGADDDASGCVAVIELGRVIAASKRPKRSVFFAFYGSEEAGGFGSSYFVQNLAFPKEKLIANLQFEMLGRADEKVKPNELWLTGYDRSNLGSELAKQGAMLVADPHPDQNFFQRSDNYTLAREGIIAHTVSSYGLHTDYHQASDEIKTIDFVHMTRSINSMIAPINWLLNSDFKPAWYEGKRP